MSEPRSILPAQEPGRPVGAVLAMPTFHLILLSVMILTVLSLSVSVFLVIHGINLQSVVETQLIDTCSTTWKMGFGAVLGLISGKAMTAEPVLH
jgi:hypothetical protein